MILDSNIKILSHVLNCGKINNVGYSRLYKCNYCKKELDRDLNGAINILQKSINIVKEHI